MAYAELQQDGTYMIHPSTDSEASVMRELATRRPVSREYAALILAAYRRASDAHINAEIHRAGF